MAFKIKKGDRVIILSGKDQGHVGNVHRIKKIKNKLTHVWVEGAGLVKKHVRPNPQANQPGGILDRELAIPIGKVAVYNPVQKKGDRVKFKVNVDGKKVRIFCSNDEQLEV